MLVPMFLQWGWRAIVARRAARHKQVAQGKPQS
jgi:hypothetical protein